MGLGPDLLRAIDRASVQNRPVNRGRVKALVGVCVEVSGLHCATGDLCTIHTNRGDLMAEVVGFRRDSTLIMPLAEMAGIAPLDSVSSHARPLAVATGSALLGRVIDALGNPIDGGPPIIGRECPVVADAPGPLKRDLITEPVETGISAIDGFLTCGRGQRVGVFSGSGVGKSTLLGMIARGGIADVNVIALIGERGREVRDFVEGVLGEEGMRKSVVVVATSDSAPMLRFKGPFTAVTIAEAFRAQGCHVMFMMDSVTRFAGAAREIGLAAGEPPTLRGYPPSLFAHLPRLVERLGNDDRGSITGLLSVLVEGDDLDEPVSDALRGYLDGHIVLSRSIAARGKFPALDVLQSVSRLMPTVASPEHQKLASRLRELLAHYEEHRDLIQVGAYRKGADPLLDVAMSKISTIEDLIYQGVDPCTAGQTLLTMQQIMEDSTNPHGMVDK